jgi:hypothetical protein
MISILEPELHLAIWMAENGSETGEQTCTAVFVIPRTAFPDKKVNVTV